MKTADLPGFDHHWVGDPAGLLCIWRVAAATRSCLMISPFGEEQSRCRRLQYDISAELAQNGLLCCWFDLPGTGDSPLSETEITSDAWLAAVTAAVAWLETSVPTLCAIGGLRLGAAVAADWMQQQHQQMPVLALEPINGSYALRALLRARLTQENMSSEQLLQRLASGAIVEAAGYPLSAKTQATLERFAISAAHPAHILTLRSLQGQIPPWLQVEPSNTATLATELADQMAPLLLQATPR